MIVAKMAKGVHLSEVYIRLVARTANHRYKVYEIPKKTGGTRTIFHPARELKLLQTWLVENLFSKLPVHPAAAAYRMGSSVKRHASVHRHNKYLLKVDFRDFFPSITGRDVVGVLRKRFGSGGTFLVGPRDYDIVRRIVCRNDRLAIGAPSSPALCNAVMYRFDFDWSSRCKNGGIAYTRYADDLYFSTNRPNTLARILEELRTQLRFQKSPILQINDKKTVFTSRKRRRLVTGVVITPEGRLSLGRKKKRYIKSLLFRHRQGNLSPEESSYLRGFISFARSVEPTFIETLKKKYGPKALSAALEYNGPLASPRS